MIIDKIENAKLYYPLHPKFKSAFEVLIKGEFALGKNIIDNDLYVNYEEYATYPINERRFEAHKNYIDIQFVVEGQEKMGVCDISETEILENYDKERDVMFLSAKNPNFINVKKGYFIIFYPNDAHMPCLLINEAQKVKKFVGKVKI